MARLPPLWISRQVGSRGNVGQSDEVRKLLGEPIPRKADINQLPPHIAEMFDEGAILDRIAKKLGMFAKKRHKKIIPAHNTIACIDDEDNIYVGVEFLEKFGEDNDLLAGILAHEWGHMISTLPRGVNWSHLTWEQLHQLRRDEEADADGFAGRALYLMGYKPSALMEFLKKIDRRRNKKLPSVKYHNTATRLAILKAAFEAQERAFETAQKINFNPKKLIGQG